MKSRMDRYNDSSSSNLEQKRTKRLNKNQELYNNIGTNTKYTNFSDVTNANTYLINNNIKNTNHTRESYQHVKEYTNIAPKTRVKKELDDFNHLYQDHENRVYDINSVLQKAKEERKDKDELEEKRKLKNTNYNILASLNPEELEKYRKEKLKRLKPDEDELRDLIDTITSKTLAGEISKETGIDLLSDLMATNAMDRITNDKDDKLELSKEILDKDEIKKIDEEKNNIVPSTNKNDNTKDLDKSFYTKSMDLSDKDFYSDDEDEDDEKKIPVIVKILLVLVLIALVGISIYFVYQSI